MKTDDLVEAMQAEALRLTDLQCEILGRIGADAGLSFDDLAPGSPVEAAPSGGTSEFDKGGIAARVAILKEQRRKVEHFEAVLAVVGTMKAGKSTTINAIVGRELMPNRNRPMTALPTVIRHLPGRFQPLLRLQKVEPLDDLARRIKGRLTKADGEIRSLIDADEHLLALTRDIYTGFDFAKVCEGDEEIFLMLARLNDLVRLSSVAGLDFPFQEFESIADLPLIEVAFGALVDTIDSGKSGRLSLLDTPGFNEAGHSAKLLPLMQDQLRRASAVVSVLDYTQLKSDAEAQLRAALEEIASQAKGRMFALVNKFDEKTAKGDDADRTRAYVSQTLLGQQLPRDRIYPISAQLAFWAVRAKAACEAGGASALEAEGDGTWVADFGRAAWGRNWRASIGSAEEVMKASDDLWDDSRFQAPLTSVVRFAHRRAADFSVDASLSELQRGWKPLAEMLRTRADGFHANRANVEALISQAGAGIAALQRVQQQTSRRIEDAISRAEESLRGQARTAAESAKKRVRQFLSDGGIAAEEVMLAQLQGELERFAAFRKWKQQSSEECGEFMDKTVRHLVQDFDRGQQCIEALRQRAVNASIATLRSHLESRPAGRRGKAPASTGSTPESFALDPTICYPNRAEADAALRKGRAMVTTIVQGSIESVQAVLRAEQVRLRKELEEQAEALREQAKAFHHRASRLGFASLEPTVPARRRIVASKWRDLLKVDAVADQSVTTSANREQPTTWGRFKRSIDFFGRQWGFDRVSVTESRFVIDKAELQKTWLHRVDEVMDDLSRLVEDEFCTPARTQVAEFFEQAQIEFARIERNLMKVQQDLGKDEAEKQRIESEVLDLSGIVRLADEDTEQLKAEVAGRLAELVAPDAEERP